MDPQLSVWIILGYFLMLLIISLITGKDADSTTFFTANRNAPWYLVAFGMIGTTLSGVTFISVPGAVGGGSDFTYFQFVLGNLVGYWIIAGVLLPLYYSLGLTSIYEYLAQRFGEAAYKTGAIFFLLSRIVGASLRLFLVALVLKLAVGDYLNLSFAAIVGISLALIYLFTFRGGIKTVVWTDTIQTFCMLLGVGITMWIIADSFGDSFGAMVGRIRESAYSRIFEWNWEPGTNFFKQFISGACISIVMVGLDQDMMQKNLTVRTIEGAQKNMRWFSVSFLMANLVFLGLGALLYLYGQSEGILREVFDGDCALQLLGANGEWACYNTDELFPKLALEYLGPTAAIVFLIGVIAAAYSSADSALTALTTSFMIDILGVNAADASENGKASNIHKKADVQRFGIHAGFAGILFIVILLFEQLNDRAVVFAIFRLAGYTYGPLLGMFSFGMFTKRKVKDSMIPIICTFSPLLSYFIQWISPKFGYTFGFELLLLNGLITFTGLWLFSKKEE